MTFLQIYDASLVTPEQETDNNPITSYKPLKIREGLDINTHDDTVANYIFGIDPQEYSERIDKFIE